MNFSPKWIPLSERRGEERFGEKPLLFFLYKTKDNKYVEARPLFSEEDRHYSGGPMEYVEVDQEYVKLRYPNIENK